MTFQPLTGILISILFGETVAVMAIWHTMTHGTWTTFPAGRVLMGILATMSLITGLAAASSFFPEFAFRPYLYIILYVLFILVMGWLGWTIAWAQHRHRERTKK